MLVVWGSIQQKDRAIWGQNLHENYCVKSSTKSMEKFVTNRDFLFTWMLENAGGLRIQTSKTEDNLRAKFA